MVRSQDKCHPRLIVLGDGLRRDARTAPFLANGDLDAGDPAGGGYYLAIGETAAVAQVVDSARFLGPVEREKMRCRQVGDVDVVADAGSVAGRIVGTEE